MDTARVKFKGVAERRVDMPRDTARKIQKSPGGVGAVVQRDSTGTVQTSEHKSGSTTGFSNTTGTAAGTLKGTGLYAFTTANIQATSLAAANTPVNVTISRDGNQLATGTLTGTGTQSYSYSGTHYTPLNAPNWTFSASVSGGSTTLSYTASREDRWV